MLRFRYGIELIVFILKRHSLEKSFGHTFAKFMFNSSKHASIHILIILTILLGHIQSAWKSTLQWHERHLNFLNCFQDTFGKLLGNFRRYCVKIIEKIDENCTLDPT